MRKWLARKMIAYLGKRYDYDVSYLRYLLDHSPKAFMTFTKATALSRHRERAPLEATFTVRLMATMFEDCGPCTQMLVQYAQESGMPAAQIEAVLRREVTAMTPAVHLAHRYADAILNRRADADSVRDAVRASWGDRGVIDLALSMQGARLYPMMKEALGFARECRRVKIEDRWIDVARHAA